MDQSGKDTMVNTNYKLSFGSEKCPDGDILFVSMYTQSYEHLARRLKESLEKHDLCHAIYETPTVHNSISPKGSPDLSYTKSALIQYVITKNSQPVVFVDCDCVIRKFPSLFFEIRSQTDFAVYNWLGPEDNSVYYPVNSIGDVGRMYQYIRKIPYESASQIVCSGAVQFWGNTKASIELLQYWQHVIENNPGSPDDYCLDYAQNNFAKFSVESIRLYSLPKKYARYAWWIYDEPVIDHPQMPGLNSHWREIELHDGSLRVYFDHMKEKDASREVSRSNLCIDTLSGVVIESTEESRIVQVNGAKKTWISRESL